MGGVTPRRANQLLRSLRRRSLVGRNRKAHLHSDEGLTYLARRDRADIGPARGAGWRLRHRSRLDHDTENWAVFELALGAAAPLRARTMPNRCDPAIPT